MSSSRGRNSLVLLILILIITVLVFQFRGASPQPDRLYFNEVAEKIKNGEVSRVIVDDKEGRDVRQQVVRIVPDVEETRRDRHRMFAQRRDPLPLARRFGSAGAGRPVLPLSAWGLGRRGGGNGGSGARPGRSGRGRGPMATHIVRARDRGCEPGAAGRGATLRGDGLLGLEL